MGLDMYLEKQIYVGAQYDHKNVHAKIEIISGSKKLKIDPKKILHITEAAGYWRKSNQIHKWFVDNAQKGVDDCKHYYVSYEQLLQLKKLCEEVLLSKDASKLPPEKGFFFGGTEIDEYYWQDLKDTIEIIEKLEPDTECSYYYHSSW